MNPRHALVALNCCLQSHTQGAPYFELPSGGTASGGPSSSSGLPVADAPMGSLGVMSNSQLQLQVGAAFIAGSVEGTVQGREALDRGAGAGGVGGL